ncbi:HD-GYP domain (HD superfamily hydrolase) [gamma proteobacterium IMCC2047]|nr:HD-GYP domain (HD superfamily hydrolase) [gamma proteobacterium IMCC2047]
MSTLIETIENEIISAIASDQLVLPTLPEVSLRVREVAQDDNAGVADLSRVISNDAAISARIIKVCNSPLLRAAQPVETLQMAINRLGMSYSADLAVGLAMAQMFQATTDLIDSRMRDVWNRSTEVAGMCNMLAQQHTRLSPGQATLAGITHLIGALPILRFAEENEALLNDAYTLDEVIAKLHPKLGGMILKAWDFAPELCEVPEQYLNFQRQSEKPDFVDLVTVATIQSYAGTDHPYNELDCTTIPAFAQLGIDASPEEDEEEEDLSANMEAALALLG